MSNDKAGNFGKEKQPCQKCGRKECECKKYECEEVCDCCCTPGLLEELKRLIGTRVLIGTSNGDYLVGTLLYADCDVARINTTAVFFAGAEVVTEISLFASISICEIDTVIDLPELDPGQETVSFADEIKRLLNNKKGE